MTKPYKIAVASNSVIKIQACKDAFTKAAMSNVSNIEIKGYDIASSVSAQPVGDETIAGATNRLLALKKQVHDADIYVSIENGLFMSNGIWFDIPIIAVSTSYCPLTVIFGNGMALAPKIVREAKDKGFDTTTIGMVLHEWGHVDDPQDPHKCLAGKSRAKYIEDALLEVISLIGSDKLISVTNRIYRPD